MNWLNLCSKLESVVLYSFSMEYLYDTFLIVFKFSEFSVFSLLMRRGDTYIESFDELVSFNRFFYWNGGILLENEQQTVTAKQTEIFAPMVSALASFHCKIKKLFKSNSGFCLTENALSLKNKIIYYKTVILFCDVTKCLLMINIKYKDFLLWWNWLRHTIINPFFDDINNTVLNWWWCI